jgi:histidinol-phosphate/aromatic aminotransferase/cobyric acid decarboxylase-like protein
MTVTAHGGATVAAGLLDLSASMNPVAPDAAPVVARHLDAVGRYPDADAATRALAEVMVVDPDRLLLTNGGAEAIALVAAELGRGWADECDFALYRRHLPVLDRDGPRFRSNPHNPTGLLAAADERADVWDEAFYPLATGRWTRGDDAVVVGSLTKVLACPGLRIGYVLADPGFVERVARRRPQWSVNGLACAALPELLARVDLGAWSEQVAVLRAALIEILDVAGLRPQPSDANYVVCDDIGAQLAAHGIVVRDCTSFGLGGFMRVAVPDERGLARLEAALR